MKCFSIMGHKMKVNLFDIMYYIYISNIVNSF